MASPDDRPFRIDEALRFGWLVFGGGGDEDHMLEIAPRDITRLTGDIMAD